MSLDKTWLVVRGTKARAMITALFLILPKIKQDDGC